MMTASPNEFKKCQGGRAWQWISVAHWTRHAARVTAIAGRRFRFPASTSRYPGNHTTDAGDVSRYTGALGIEAEPKSPAYRSTRDVTGETHQGARRRLSGNFLALSQNETEPRTNSRDQTTL